MDQTNYIEYNGIEVEQLENNKIRTVVTLKEEGKNLYGMMHGGLIFSLADTTAGMFTRSLGINSVTLSANINYIKAVRSGKAYGYPILEHQGKSTVVIRVNVLNESDELVAVGMFTMFVS